jgi:hypothetical protein
MVQSFHFTDYGMENYYYEIEVFVSTLGLHEPYTHIEQIADLDLRQARSKAIQRHNDIENGLLANGRFYLHYASPADFVYGENACYSITLWFVHTYGDVIEKYALAGVDDASHIEGLEFENYIFYELNEE